MKATIDFLIRHADTIAILLYVAFNVWLMWWWFPRACESYEDCYKEGD